MMDEKIDISLDRIQNCIQEINRNDFTTAEAR